MKLYPTVLIPDLEDKLLIPVENVYLLTVDEIKKIVNDAWDAGFRKSVENSVDHMIEISNPTPDKEAYLNNLKLD